MRPLGLKPLIQDMVAALRELAAGRSENGGTFTLTPSSTTTVVSRRGIAPGDHISITATTSTAAAEIGNGTIYIGSVVKDGFTVTHANAVSTTRTFTYTFVATLD